MKIKLGQLKQIIRESIRDSLNEGPLDYYACVCIDGKYYSLQSGALPGCEQVVMHIIRLLTGDKSVSVNDIVGYEDIAMVLPKGDQRISGNANVRVERGAINVPDGTVVPMPKGSAVGKLWRPVFIVGRLPEGWLVADMALSKIETWPTTE